MEISFKKKSIQTENYLHKIDKPQNPTDKNIIICSIAFLLF